MPKAIKTIIAIIKLCIANGETVSAKIENGFVSNMLPLCKSYSKIKKFSNLLNFIDQPKIINGASNLLVEIFGDQGRHTRVAVGTNALPFGIAVEIDAIIQLK